MTVRTPPRRLAVLDAPSNLGLRPPAPGTVPGCYKLAGALRDQGLLARIRARDAGCVTPPRYDRAGWKRGDGVFNADALAAYSRRLAARCGALLDRGELPVVLGGDCSILLGTGLSLRRRGRFGLAFVDGHTDFRHPGNSDAIGAAAGEDLALATGRGQEDLTNLGGCRPLFRDSDVAVVAVRDADPYLPETRQHLRYVASVSEVRSAGPERLAQSALAQLDRPDLDGFWLHLDADVLDPDVMPAVDSPDPGGLRLDELAPVLIRLLGSPRCAGFQVTVFDPDLDDSGDLAAVLTDLLVTIICEAVL
jgi:arginase